MLAVLIGVCWRRTDASGWQAAAAPRDAPQEWSPVRRCLVQVARVHKPVSPAAFRVPPALSPQGVLPRGASFPPRFPSANQTNSPFLRRPTQPVRSHTNFPSDPALSNPAPLYHAPNPRRHASALHRSQARRPCPAPGQPPRDPRESPARIHQNETVCRHPPAALCKPQQACIPESRSRPLSN